MSALALVRSLRCVLLLAGSLMVLAMLRHASAADAPSEVHGMSDAIVDA